MMTKQSQKQSSTQVQWYSSISFKLFSLITLFLGVCVGAVTWQQIGVLRDFLHRQIEESTLQKSRDVINETFKSLQRWENTMNLITTRMAGSSIEAYADFLTSFLQSEEAISTFELMDLQPQKSPNSLIFSVNPKALIDGSGMKNIIKAFFLNSSQSSNNIETNSILHIDNLEDITNLSLVGLTKKFKVSGQAGELRAFLTLNHDSIFGRDREDQAIAVLIFDENTNLLFKRGDRSLIEEKIIDLVKGRFARGSMMAGLKSEQISPAKQVLISTDQVPRYGLRIGVIQDASGARKAVKKTLIHTLLWVAVALLSAIFVSYIASFSMTLALKKMTALTKMIAEGDLDAQVSISGKDEVTSLAKSINQMAGQIKELLLSKVAAAQQEKELETARLVQESFFPKENLNSNLLTINGKCYPASACGGDIWGYFPVTDFSHYFFIADVTGHGVPAALVTAMAYIEWQSIVLNIRETKEVMEPSDILKRLNDIFVLGGGSRITMTMFVARVDLSQGKLWAANAGHNFPFIVTTDQENLAKKHRAVMDSNTQYLQDGSKKGLPSHDQIICKKIICHGMPLGFQKDTTYVGEVVDLKPGDKIFAYTDGLFECQNSSGQPWGERQLKKAIIDAAHLEAEKLHEAVASRAFKHFADTPRADDVTILALEISKNWSLKAVEEKTNLRNLA